MCIHCVLWNAPRPRHVHHLYARVRHKTFSVCVVARWPNQASTRTNAAKHLLETRKRDASAPPQNLQHSDPKNANLDMNVLHCVNPMRDLGNLHCCLIAWLCCRVDVQSVPVASGVQLCNNSPSFVVSFHF